MNNEEISKIIANIKLKTSFDGGDELWGQALSVIKHLQAENAALHERLRITKMALEYACLETLQSKEEYFDELKEKVNKYIKQAEDVFNSEKNGRTFTFVGERLKELKGEKE